MDRPLRYTALLALVLAVTACVGKVPLPAEADLSAALVDRTDDTPPPQPAGACWAAAVIPAVFETVTEQVRAKPDRRTAATPATFRTETRQVMLADRRAVWVRTPCPDTLTPEVIATLQRALIARGVYPGPVTGLLDAPTTQAIRTWQRPRGLDSDVLALATAQAFGLVPGEF